MRTPFYKRYLVPILSVVMLGVGLTTTLSYFHTKRSVEALAIGQMTQALSFLNREISEKVKGIDSDVILWSQEEVFRLALTQGYLGRSARAASDRRLAERVYYNGYGRALIAAPDGSVVSASEANMAGVLNISDRDYFHRSLAGKMALDTLERGKTSGIPIMVVSAPVRDAELNITGVMAVVVDIPRVAREILNDVSIGQTGGAFILATNNRILATPTWKRDGEFSPPPDTAAALRASQPGQVIRYQAGDRERMALAARNPETGWLLVVEADSADVLRPAGRLAALNGAISLAVLGLVAVALWMLRNAMDRLRSSEARYRTLAETTPVGIATFDRQGAPSYLNQRAMDILDLAHGPFSNTETWTDRFETREGQPLAFHELPMGQAGSGVRPQQGRMVWYRLPAGGRRILYLGAAPLDRGGAQPAEVVAVIEDLTERTRIQEMMVQTEKMLSVGGLAAGMAHEINNPLASILQALQVINRRLSPDLPANVKAAEAAGLDLDALKVYMKSRNLNEFLAGMQEAGERAARIVRNMLGFSRKSGGEFLPCDLEELLDRTVELAGGDYDLKKQFDFRQIEIVREYLPDMEKVECQPMEIEQVFFNIIKNAAQALKERSTQGASPRITLRARTEGGYAVAEIEDNGPGMSEEIRKRIFEPFYTTKDIGVGTGLGLSVAFFIVSENHRGSITVESEPGRGARFIVKLPLTHVA
ncbi:sensor histidine kinase [Fundidesulfovibrio terrae]|uniref:sensor histidine kinase n=1 Tax=Fundidesulfovibrio terrae TaxID=2922866 RepID=UPI001FAF4FAD|nr:ATP-binding protein [Fundidesulfovibrio terrae]